MVKKTWKKDKDEPSSIDTSASPDDRRLPVAVCYSIQSKGPLCSPKKSEHCCNPSASF